MKIVPFINSNIPAVADLADNKKINNRQAVKFGEIKDTFEASNPIKNDKIIDINRVGKNLHVSFTGEFKNPIVREVPAVDFKLSGVMKHQLGTAGGRDAVDDTVVKLANSNWKEGKEFDYSIEIQENEKDGKIYKNKVININDKDFGTVGTVPVTLTNKFAKLIESNPAEKDNFKFTLTNVNGGVNSAYPTVGIETTFKYVGKNEEVAKQTKDLFTSLIDSDKKTVASSVSMYEEPTSPKEVLERMFDIEGQKKGLGKVRELKTAIDTISKEINNPKNKNILVLGHCKPDGDTIGCVLGMQAAIKGAYPDRNVDMAIDDDIPNNFAKLPGVDNIKRPYNGFAVYQLEKNVELLQRSDSDAAKEQIKKLQKEEERLKDPSRTFDAGSINGKPKKYDLVIMMDTPTPGRTSKNFKKYFESADKTIFIDHHPHRASEWASESKKLGLDLEKVKENNLFCVADTVPAATQIVTAIADKAGLLGKMFKNSLESAKQFVAGISAGALTDTCRFDKVASHDAKDYAKPVTQRPTYKPEGMTKWLYNELGKAGGGDIDKQWMRLNLDYELPNKRIQNADGTFAPGPRDMVLEKSVKGRIMDAELGVGMITVSYDDMQEVLEVAKKQDKKVQFNDVYSAFKSSQALTSLKMPGSVKENVEEMSARGQAYSTYKSPYDYDRLAVLITQSQKQGELNNNSQIADKNSYSFSFRSSGQSNLAQIAATLFGGGGHSQAAGGGISMKDLTLETPLKVMINGKEEKDFAKVFAKVNDIIAKKADSSEIKIEKAEKDGKSIPELIKSITAEMRKTQTPKPVVEKVPAEKTEIAKQKEAKVA